MYFCERNRCCFLSVQDLQNPVAACCAYPIFGLLFPVPITIALPDLASQTGFNLTRWTEILGDPYLANIPDRIETDRHGHILMTPPPGFRHSERQGQIIALLIQFAPQGRTLPACPISTADGVKAIDVAWLDVSRDEIGQDIPLLTRAPEICIEILSPSSSAAETAEKRLLYFDAGAAEVWMQPRRFLGVLLRS
jgi:Uma2 family endonuclease